MGRVHSLAMHAHYACRQTGRCCRAGWDVPVEARPLRLLRESAAAGRLALPAGALIEEEGLPEGAAAMLAKTPEGACVLQNGTSGLCSVHAALGPSALPVACRQFPRIALADARGTFVTLSHFCPTAAGALWRDEPLAIVAGPPAFPEGEYDGLDARDELPPLLAPGMLMDLEGYQAWEAHMVARLATLPSPAGALATLRADAALLARWRPGGTLLAGAVADLPDELPGPDAPAADVLYEEVRAAIPEALRPPPAAGPVPALDAPAHAAPVRRFLAAHAFASWCAYQGRGVRTIVRSLEAALAVLQVEAARLTLEAGRACDRELLTEAFRAADLRLRHQADRQALADSWSVAEDVPAWRAE